MNFKQFQQTKKVHPAPSIDFPEALNIHSYVDSREQIFIVELNDDHEHQFSLVIGNEEYLSDNLEHLEWVLYYFCCGENFFGETLQQMELLRDNLINQLAKFDWNGTYTDKDSIIEGMEPMSLIDALIKYDWMHAE